MCIPSNKIRYTGLLLILGVLIGGVIGIKLSHYEEKQPVIFYYADNYSGGLTGIIENKEAYTVIDKDGKYYIVSKDTYDSANKGDSLSSITE